MAASGVKVCPSDLEHYGPPCIRVNSLELRRISNLETQKEYVDFASRRKMSRKLASARTRREIRSTEAEINRKLSIA